MSRTVVFTFDGVETADLARTDLRHLETRGTLGLDEALVLKRGADGKIARRRDWSQAVVTGAIIGAFLGFLLTFMFPVISIPFGAVAGALIGRLLFAQGLPAESISDAEEALQPGTSALLLLLRTGDVSYLGTMLAKWRPVVYETTLARADESLLRHALRTGEGRQARPAEMSLASSPVARVSVARRRERRLAVRRSLDPAHKASLRLPPMQDTADLNLRPN